MIETEQYEGHTEGPWAYREDEVYAEGNPRIVALRAHGTDGELTSKLPHRWADFALIAAAPDLLAEVKRLREDNKKLHDAINGCAYANMQGSAHDLYCESIIERCPTCYQNIDDMECGCEEE